MCARVELWEEKAVKKNEITTLLFVQNTTKKRDKRSRNTCLKIDSVECMHAYCQLIRRMAATRSCKFHLRFAVSSQQKSMISQVTVAWTRI